MTEQTLAQRENAKLAAVPKSDVRAEGLQELQEQKRKATELTKLTAALESVVHWSGYIEDQAKKDAYYPNEAAQKRIGSSMRKAYAALAEMAVYPRFDRKFGDVLHAQELRLLCIDLAHVLTSVENGCGFLNSDNADYSGEFMRWTRLHDLHVRGSLFLKALRAWQPNHLPERTSSKVFVRTSNGK